MCPMSYPKFNNAKSRGDLEDSILDLDTRHSSYPNPSMQTRTYSQAWS